MAPPSNNAPGQPHHAGADVARATTERSESGRFSPNPSLASKKVVTYSTKSKTVAQTLVNKEKQHPPAAPDPPLRLQPPARSLLGSQPRMKRTQATAKLDSSVRHPLLSTGGRQPCHNLNNETEDNDKGDDKDDAEDEDDNEGPGSNDNAVYAIDPGCSATLNYFGAMKPYIRLLRNAVVLHLVTICLYADILTVQESHVTVTKEEALDKAYMRRNLLNTWIAEI